MTAVRARRSRHRSPRAAARPDGDFFHNIAVAGFAASFARNIGCFSAAQLVATGGFMLFAVFVVIAVVIGVVAGGILVLAIVILAVIASLWACVPVHTAFAARAAFIQIADRLCMARLRRGSRNRIAA